MPRAGSQVVLCDLPIRFDTYEGCSHACTYCFANSKRSIKDIKVGESAKALLGFIQGNRTQETNFCDWDIPLHWGGVSDPFQPAERVHKRSLEALKVFAQTQYPFVVSTKNAMIAESPYKELIQQCNCVVQFSVVSPKFDDIERGASSYEQRISAAAEIAKYKRVNLRVQPYIPTLFWDIMKLIPHYSEIGIHGLIFESMKYKKAVPGTIKCGTDAVYPIKTLIPHFKELRNACHKYGLKFYCAENRLRSMSDELCCCGIEGLGWNVHKANFNHFLFSNDFSFTKKMKEVGSAFVFQCLNQTTKHRRLIEKMSYADRFSLLAPYAYEENGKVYKENK